MYYMYKPLTGIIDCPALVEIFSFRAISHKMRQKKLSITSKAKFDVSKNNIFNVIMNNFNFLPHEPTYNYL